MDKRVQEKKVSKSRDLSLLKAVTAGGRDEIEGGSVPTPTIDSDSPPSLDRRKSCISRVLVSERWWEGGRDLLYWSPSVGHDSGTGPSSLCVL